mgnify:CR=1 FL=1
MVILLVVMAFSYNANGTKARFNLDMFSRYIFSTLVVILSANANAGQVKSLKLTSAVKVFATNGAGFGPLNSKKILLKINENDKSHEKKLSQISNDKKWIEPIVGTGLSDIISPNKKFKIEYKEDTSGDGAGDSADYYLYISYENKKMKLIDEVTDSYVVISPDSHFIIINKWNYLIDVIEAEKYKIDNFLGYSKNQPYDISVIKWSRDGKSILIKVLEGNDLSSRAEYWEIGLK